MTGYDMKIWGDAHICLRNGCRTETPTDRGFCDPCVEWLEARTSVDPVAPGSAS